MDYLLIILNKLFYSIITNQLLLLIRFLSMIFKYPYFILILFIIYQHYILVYIILSHFFYILLFN